VPAELAQRVAGFDTLQAALDIAEVAAEAGKPVGAVAAVYFEVANRLGLPWLTEKIGALTGGAHWRTLARSAMQDDVAALTRNITAGVVADSSEGALAHDLVGAWADANRRSLARAAQLLGELRALPATDEAMLSVALRELRALA